MTAPILVYVEIDVPAWTQTSPDSPETELTFRFAVDTDYLPMDIAAIASIKDIAIEPATISLGENLGERAVVTIKFRDHRHIFDEEDFTSGTFWGKFRARYGLTLQGNPLRLIRGQLGQSLDEMETRTYLIDRTDGPDANGNFQIVAKDMLTFAKTSQALAPLLSNGRISVAITNVSGSLTLIPSGVGSEYPASGFANLGGKEVVAFTVAGDVMTLTSRGLFNTTAIAHNADERVQLCLRYNGDDPAAIIYNLLVVYANIPDTFIPIADWQAEVNAYLGSVYTTLITEPTSVDQLVSELIEQAALAIWWDDVQQLLRLQVLRPLPSTAATFDEDNLLQGTLEVIEQPERRLSDVQIYFDQINPLVNLDENDNYRSTVRVTDDTAVTEYGSAGYKTIHSRWIPTGGETIAETLGNKQLARFRDPPRMVRFALMRDQPVDPQLGSGYQLSAYPFQTMTGAADPIPIQITRLEPRPDYFNIEAQEILWTPFGADIDPTTHTITFDGNINDVQLRSIHDDLYSAPVSGDTINVIIQSDVIIGSTGILYPGSSAFPVAFYVGTWPGGVTINITVNGRIQGRGGAGGRGGSASPAIVLEGTPGQTGGTALYTRTAINLTSTNGEIWAGGGGGGGGGGAIFGSNIFAAGGGGGGGGTGTVASIAGAGGAATDATEGNAAGTDGTAGTSNTNGTGGLGGDGEDNKGGNGGGPGLAGSPGSQSSGGQSGGGAGNAGSAIDGDSFVTDIGAAGDIRGGQIN